MNSSDLLPALDSHVLINGRTIGWTELLGQLQLFGKLRPFIQEIATQRVMIDELRSRKDLELTPSELDQAILDTRQSRQLTDEGAFQKWMAQEGLDYQNFKSRVAFELMLKKLKEKIAEPHLHQEFEKQREALEQVQISYVIADDAAQAAGILERLRSGTTSFEALAAADGGAGDASRVKAPARPVRRRWLPRELQEVLASASPGQLLGPLAVGKRWMVLRLDTVTPAELDGPIQTLISEEVFKRWMQEKINGYDIRLAPAQPVAAAGPATA